VRERQTQRHAGAVAGSGAVFTAPRRTGGKIRKDAKPRATKPAARAPGAPSQPTTPTQPAQPSQPSQPSPSQLPRPAPGSLHATVVVENSWNAGWCGHLEVTGPDATLAGVQASFTLPAGTRIAQAWNAERSGDSGRVTLTLPAWAQLRGGPYSSTGFCVEGAGEPSGLSIS
jgi:cellulase/cellobiase CelA1